MRVSGVKPGGEKGHMGFSQDSLSHVRETFSIITPRIRSLGRPVPRLVMLGRQDMPTDAGSPEAFFGRMGFPVVDSLDITADEGASIVHDLNTPIGEDLEQQFDCVYDGGTLEHVFDVKTNLFNIHNMLRGGGAIVHAVPVNNWVNHGFFQVSPALLTGFYDENGYEIAKLKLFGVVKGATINVFSIAEYSGADVVRLGLSSRITFPASTEFAYMVSMVFVAFKPLVHVPARIPQQPFYNPKYAGDEYRSAKKMISFK